MEKSYQKHLLIDPELDRYERLVNEIISDLETVKYSEIADREGWKEGAKGGAYKTTIATKEQIKKDYRDAVEKLPKYLNSLDELRNKYAEKQFRTRGDVETKNTGLDFTKKLTKIAEDEE